MERGGRAALRLARRRGRRPPVRDPPARARRLRRRRRPRAGGRRAAGAVRGGDDRPPPRRLDLPRRHRARGDRRRGGGRARLRPGDARRLGRRRRGRGERAALPHAGRGDPAGRLDGPPRRLDRLLQPAMVRADRPRRRAVARLGLAGGAAPRRPRAVRVAVGGGRPHRPAVRDRVPHPPRLRRRLPLVPRPRPAALRRRRGGRQVVRHLHRHPRPEGGRRADGPPGAPRRAAGRRQRGVQPGRRVARPGPVAVRRGAGAPPRRRRGADLADRHRRDVPSCMASAGLPIPDDGPSRAHAAVQADRRRPPAPADQRPAQRPPRRPPRLGPPRGDRRVRGLSACWSRGARSAS